MSLEPNRKYLALLQFRLRVHESDGDSFEKLFARILDFRFKHFKPVKAWGNLGDRKNDGFDESTGCYYQVYAPENIKNSRTLTDAIKKLKVDFKGLYEQWDDVVPIKEFRFVVNDKFNGIHPDLTRALKELEEEYPDIKFSSFIAKDLRNILFELEEAEIQDCIGVIPSLEPADLDYDVLNEVVKELLSVPVDYSAERIPSNPNFDQKLEFNELSDTISTLLKTGSYSEGDLENFFRLDDGFQKESLRLLFSKYYEEGIEKYGDNDGDAVFYHILTSSSKTYHSKPIQDAVIVLMAYYFSYCDIFREPPKDGQYEIV